MELAAGLASPATMQNDEDRLTQQNLEPNVSAQCNMHDKTTMPLTSVYQIRPDPVTKRDFCTPLGPNGRESDGST